MHTRGAPAAARTAPARSCTGRRPRPPQTGPSAAGCPVRPPAAPPARGRRSGASGRPCSGHPGCQGTARATAWACRGLGMRSWAGTAAQHPVQCCSAGARPAPAPVRQSTQQAVGPVSAGTQSSHFPASLQRKRVRAPAAAPVPCPHCVPHSDANTAATPASLLRKGSTATAPNGTDSRKEP